MAGRRRSHGGEGDSQREVMQESHSGEQLAEERSQRELVEVGLQRLKGWMMSRRVSLVGSASRPSSAGNPRQIPMSLATSSPVTAAQTERRKPRTEVTAGTPGPWRVIAGPEEWDHGGYGTTYRME
jgi:hypothetical protein